MDDDITQDWPTPIAELWKYLKEKRLEPTIQGPTPEGNALIAIDIRDREHIQIACVLSHQPPAIVAFHHGWGFQEPILVEEAKTGIGSLADLARAVEAKVIERRLDDEEKRGLDSFKGLRPGDRVDFTYLEDGSDVPPDVGPGVESGSGVIKEINGDALEDNVTFVVDTGTQLWFLEYKDIHVPDET